MPWRLIIIAVIYSFLSCPMLAKGEDSRNESDLLSKWELILGVHHAKRAITIHYERKNDPSNVTKDIGDAPTDTGYQAYGFVSFRYLLNENSALEFDYSESGIDETGVMRRRVRIFGIPLRIAFRTPVQLETKSIRLRYAHTLLKGSDWHLDGVVGIRDISANAIYLRSDFTRQTDYYQAYLPTLGGKLSYRWNDAVSLSSRIDYLPIKTKISHGYISDLDIGIEYRLYPNHAIGLGYRHSAIQYHNNRDKSLGNLSYAAHGPFAYWGVRF